MLTRRMLSKTAAYLLALTVSVPTFAADQFIEGTHYQLLPISVETRDPDKVEVIEVFSYGCVHCFNFDPYLEAWRGKTDSEVVNFYRVPAIFNSDWEMLAQAFYTAETLGVGEQVHMPLFRGVHEQRQDVRKAEVLAPIFAAEADVAEDDFMTAHNSFSVRSRVQQAKAKTRAYKVTGVPSMVVNGKYLIDGRMAGGNVKMLEVVDFLVDREQRSATSVAQDATAATE